MQDPQQTRPSARQHRQTPPASYTPTASDMRATGRTSSSTSTTDYEEMFSDLDSIHDIPISPVQSNQSSRTTSPSDPNGASRKSRTSGLRLSLKSLRPKSSSYVPAESEQSPDLFSLRRSLEGARVPYGRRTSLESHPHDGRISFDSVDPRRRDQLASPPQLSTSAPKTSSRFSFIHAPVPSTPTMVRRTQHNRSYTTPTNSPNPSSYGNSPHRSLASPSPKPVKETRTMMKDYDPMTGNKMINKYMVVRELGRGVHGKVKLCRDTVTGELCAIKIVDKTTRKRLGRAQISNEQKIRREIAIMKKCIHPNVVRLIEVIDDPTARKIYLVLEYMEGGEVRWKDADDKPILPLDDARAIFRDVVLGLEYLHMQGIIHRDIKPANLLLAGDGTVKISDFGVSHFSEKNALERDLENTPTVEQGFHHHHHHSTSNPFEGFFRHSTPHSPLALTLTGHPQFSSVPQSHQWGDDLELAKTAGSPAFFAPELCYASEFSPAMSPALSSASQTSFILSPPTPRTNPSTPLGTFSTSTGHGYAPRPPITKAIDIWALGVTLYCFIYGRCPFIAETEFELFNIIPRKQPSYLDSVPGRDCVSPSLKDLLSKLLEKDVSKRITLKEVKEHPWVVEDLDDPERWRIETDPGNYQRVCITDEDLKGAVTIIDKIKNRIRKLSVSLTNFTLNRRRSKSISSAQPPESPSGPRSPIPIMPSPVPTTSQSTAHATAQPHSFVSQLSLPERFQHFHLSGISGSNLGPSRTDRLERPNSACSNSSIEEIDEGEEQSGSGSSVQNSAGYVGRRRIFRPAGPHSQSAGYERRPLSAGSFPSSSSRRNYSDDHLDHGHGLYGRTVLGRASFNGTASARVVPTNHSSLSKSWVHSPPTEPESSSGDSCQQRAEQVQSVPQRRLSHRASTLSPSSTLVSDNIQEQAEHGYLDGSQESLAKSPEPDTTTAAQSLATHQEL